MYLLYISKEQGQECDRHSTGICYKWQKSKRGRQLKQVLKELRTFVYECACFLLQREWNGWIICRCMNSFVLAAVTNYHELRGLKQFKVTTILQFWRSGVQKVLYWAKSKCQRPALFLKFLGRIHPLAFSGFQKPPAFLDLWPLLPLQTQH